MGRPEPNSTASDRNELSGDDFELVQHQGCLLDTGLVLGGHDDGGGFGGDHRIQGLIDAGDAIEVRFEECCDRGGAIDQSAGRPVNGKKDGDIVQHARPLSGWEGFEFVELCAAFP